METDKEEEEEELAKDDALDKARADAYAGGQPPLAPASTAVLKKAPGASAQEQAAAAKDAAAKDKARAAAEAEKEAQDLIQELLAEPDTTATTTLQEQAAPGPTAVPYEAPPPGYYAPGQELDAEVM